MKREKIQKIHDGGKREKGDRCHGLQNLSFLIIIILIIIISGCTRRPKGILSDSEMEDLLVELLIGEAYDQGADKSALPDSLRNKIGEGILLKHNIDAATLDSTYSWYAANMDEYYKLYTRVDARIKKMRAKAGGGIVDLAAANDLWILPRHILFSPLAKTDTYIFDVPMENISKGDALEWRFHISAPVDMDVKLGLNYSDSTLSMVEKRFSSDRSVRLKIISDTARRVTNIFGTITIDSARMPVWTDSISLVRFPYDSLEYVSYRYQRFSSGPRKMPDLFSQKNDSSDSKSPDLNVGANNSAYTEIKGSEEIMINDKNSGIMEEKERQAKRELKKNRKSPARK